MGLPVYLAKALYIYCQYLWPHPGAWMTEQINISQIPSLFFLFYNSVYLWFLLK